MADDPDDIGYRRSWDRNGSFGSENGYENHGKVISLPTLAMTDDVKSPADFFHLREDNGLEKETVEIVSN